MFGVFGKEKRRTLRRPAARTVVLKSRQPGFGLIHLKPIEIKQIAAGIPQEGIAMLMVIWHLIVESLAE